MKLVVRLPCKSEEPERFLPVALLAYRFRADPVAFHGKSLYSVANMAPYAISSSLILVIHDNMINGTNHIV
jgi:ABC-type sugar transport system permease subunit